MIGLIVFLVLIVIVLLYLVGAYNGLVGARNRTDEAYSDIEVQMKRRHDLIPNLVESVKGYVKQESGVLEEVTQARANAISAGQKGIKEQEVAENALSGALKSVFAVAENYPDLKSSDNFQQLSSELTDTEDKIMAARRFYNANVRDFNTKIQLFPTNLFATGLGFKIREFFALEGDSAAKEAVEVKF